MSRSLSLIVSVVVGSVIGNVVAGLLASALTVGHAIPPGLRVPIGLAGGLLGALAGWARHKNRTAPIVSDVHGSARFSSDKEARRAWAGSTACWLTRTPASGAAERGLG